MKPEVWAQLRNITAEDLSHALEIDGWAERKRGGSRIIYIKGQRMVSIHYHPHKTYGPKQLRGLLEDIGWSEEDLKRLKLIK